VCVRACVRACVRECCVCLCVSRFSKKSSVLLLNACVTGVTRHCVRDDDACTVRPQNTKDEGAKSNRSRTNVAMTRVRNDVCQCNVRVRMSDSERATGQVFSFFTQEFRTKNALAKSQTASNITAFKDTKGHHYPKKKKTEVGLLFQCHHTSLTNRLFGPQQLQQQQQRNATQRNAAKKRGGEKLPHSAMKPVSASWHALSPAPQTRNIARHTTDAGLPRQQRQRRRRQAQRRKRGQASRTR
jgi:hypothetical protein